MASYPAIDLRYSPGPGAGAVEDLLYAELDAFEPLAIQEHDAGGGWIVYFRSPAQRDAAHRALAPGIGGHALDLTSIDVEDEDWARRSQAGLSAITVGRITVAPPWDVPPPASSSTDTHVIVIEPSMGFGTGHHETTRLCLLLLQELELRGSRAIDVGTGSGVLALAAWSLGASPVLALDNDPDALVNARENVERNGATSGITIAEMELGSVDEAPGGIVTANLTAAVLERYAGSLVRLVAPGGRLIVSGFGPAEVDGVTAALALAPTRVVHERDWTAVLFERPRG